MIILFTGFIHKLYFAGKHSRTTKYTDLLLFFSDLLQTRNINLFVFSMSDCLHLSKASYTVTFQLIRYTGEIKCIIIKQSYAKS